MNDGRADERRRSGGAALVGILAALAAFPAWSAPAVEVVFEVNDALVKDKRLPGVAVAIDREGIPERELGKTGADGRLAAQLEPGSWRVTYRLAGYVSIERTALEVGQPATVTATLSPMLEAEPGQPTARRIQFVMNWGSRPAQIKDLDAHCTCSCGSGHVYYSAKKHQCAKGAIDLDVDDLDWGGPETVTLMEPAEGTYSYWLRNFSGWPATIGASEIVVRVIFGDRVAGEFRPPAGFADREWKPFKQVVVGADLEPTIVPFTPEELAEQARAPVEPPPPPPFRGPFGASATNLWSVGGGILALAVLLGLSAAIKRLRRGR